MDVILTKQAERELEDAAEWWSVNRSPSQGSRWYKGFSEAIEALADEHARWPLAREYERVAYEIRELTYGLRGRPTHRAVFTVSRQNVVVLRIRHLAQDDLTESDLP